VKVAIKVLRRTMDNKDRERFFHECYLWRSLSHRNIVPFLGILKRFEESMGMVSPFCVQGDLRTYLSSNGNSADLIQLISGLTAGINYLHEEQKIVHGDLSMSNVLVSDEGEACITDFGLSRRMIERQISEKERGSRIDVLFGKIRYMAPELMGVFDDPIDGATFACDIYSFSMIALEIVTRLPAFHNLSSDVQIIRAHLRNERPQRDLYPIVSDRVWDFFCACWAGDPFLRPRSIDLSGRIQEIADDLHLSSEG